jgi:2,3-bisphosphoglycerate-independent phosphoglycerate mutase
VNLMGQKRPRPVVLTILDGWGVTDNPKSAVFAANTPVINDLVKKYPTALLKASGETVGLMDGQMGDSNVGHLTLGAGRIVYQDLVRISKDIKEGSFMKNPTLLKAIEIVKEHGSSLHIMGLLSDGGVHSHEEHFYAVLDMAKAYGISNVYIHAFLDGRDVPPRSAGIYLERLENKIKQLGTGVIASITGRYHAMDRDRRWDRTQRAYDMLTQGKGRIFEDWRKALTSSYEEDTSDEFVVPSITSGFKFRPVYNNDSVIFMNFRADRAIQITRAFTDKEFKYFNRRTRPDAYFCAMLRYEEELNIHYCYLPYIVHNSLGEVVSKKGLSQLRIAETEKYAHVTFFFSGKKEEPFPGEDRCLIPSPKVPTYDLKPEMSAYEVTQAAVEKIQSGKYDLIVLNYANPDMVGHTGSFPAAVKALEVVDTCLGKLLEVVLKQGGIALACADHGNVEELVSSEDGRKAHTYHTANPVNCILVGAGEDIRLKPGGLSNVAPTLLELMGIDIPPEMDSESLIVRKGDVMWLA